MTFPFPSSQRILVHFEIPAAYKEQGWQTEVIDDNKHGTTYKITPPADTEKAAFCLKVQNDDNYATREIEALQKIHDRDTRQTSSIKQEGDLAYVSMPAPKGQRLNDMLTALKKEEMDDPTLYLKNRIAIFQALSLALTRLHNSGVAHRNLRPENIWVEKVIHSDNSHYFRVHLINYGRAYNDSCRYRESINSLCDDEGFGTLFTDSYTAPEVRKDVNLSTIIVASTADVFALGKLINKYLPELKYMAEQMTRSNPDQRLSLNDNDTTVGIHTRLATMLANPMDACKNEFILYKMQRKSEKEYSSMFATSATLDKKTKIAAADYVLVNISSKQKDQWSNPTQEDQIRALMQGRLGQIYDLFYKLGVLKTPISNLDLLGQTETTKRNVETRLAAHVQRGRMLH